MSTAASSQFDAYHKWLGIPPAEQPPHYYRLLGIALYEADVEVIAAASDRQMAHIKSFAAGRHAAASQSLLNELARARVTLLNARRKANYDRGLQRHLDSISESNRDAQDDAAHDAVIPSSAPTAEALELQLLFRSESRHRVRRYQRRNRRLADFAILAVVLAVIAAGVFYAAKFVPIGRKFKSAPATAPRRIESEDTHDRANEELMRRRQEQLRRDEAERRERLQAPPIVQSPPPAQREFEMKPDAMDVGPQLDLSVDLDLETHRQRHVLKDAVPERLRVLAIAGCEAPHVIKPKEGDLDERNKVTVIIDSVRTVTAEVSLVVNSAGIGSILVEYQFTDRAGTDRPFSLRHLDRACRELTQDGDAAVVRYDDMEAERRRLVAWIAAPVAKSLAARGQARARVAELSILISEQSSFITSLRADLEVAKELQLLAQHLHDECELEISCTE